MRFSSLAVMLALLLGGCTSNSASKLDRDYGIQGFVVGDSLAAFYKEVIGESLLSYKDYEREILGLTLTPNTQIEEPRHQFLYGILFDEMWTYLVNGSVGYIFVFKEPDSARTARILDSLHTNYGRPAEVKDTTIAKRTIVNRKWAGDKVELHFTVDNEFGDNLGIAERSSVEAIDRFYAQIGALADEGISELNSANSIGGLELPFLESQFDSYPDTRIVKEHVSDYGFDYYRTSYMLKYQVFDPFFSSGLTGTNEATLYFEDDTLSVITFDTPDSYAKVINAVGRRLGEYSIQEQYKENGWHWKEKPPARYRAYWLSRNVSLFVEEKSSSETEVTFYIGKLPTKLH